MRTVIGEVSQRASTYAAIKNELLRLRFPYATLHEKSIRAHLPRLHSNPRHAVRITNAPFYPKNLYIEEAVYDGFLSQRVRGLFPGAAIRKITSLKDYTKQAGPYRIAAYNKRRDNLFVIREQFDFFKRCPCTSGAVSCGYHIMNLGFGCPYECTYCYLQDYTNAPGLLLSANIDDFIAALRRYAKPGQRVGTGEFTDSLAMDHITQYSPAIIDAVRDLPGITFEFKTKSANIGNLLGRRHGRNIVISWSLNPLKIIEENEFYAAPLEKRLAAALECTGAGYRVGFHFDPILHYAGWDTDYADLVNRLFDTIKQRSSIAWISLGTLRFNRAIKPVIENRFPDTRILDGELLIGFDRKLRYPHTMRLSLYERMLSLIRKRSRAVPVYLCMEDKAICNALRPAYGICARP